MSVILFITENLDDPEWVDVEMMEVEQNKEMRSSANNNAENKILLNNNYDYFLESLSDTDEHDYNAQISSTDDSTDEFSSTEDLSEFEEQSETYTDTNLSTKLRKWYSDGTIAKTHLNSLLAILREEGYSELPKDSRTLLNTPRKTVITPCEPGEYFHYGLQQALTDILDQTKIKDSNILIDINVDGLPLTKSTHRTLWPIQGKLVNYSTVPIFVIGVYHGNAKPESIFDYLKFFIEEYQNLSTEGFIHNKKRYTVQLRCNPCDTPARSFCTNTAAHNGTFGCGKCSVKGRSLNYRMCFLNEDAPLRTDETFRRRLQEDHHHGESPFEKLPIDMIKSFPLDYMHLVCLGVTKLLLKTWIKRKPTFSEQQTKNLSDDFVNLSKFVPLEFNRKPHSLFELARWKATVLRFFLLYAGPIILTGHLKNKYVIHFNSLAVAIRILCHPKDCRSKNEYANELLRYFVRQFKTIYGQDYTVFNVHNLIHLAADAYNYGPLDSFSSFPFENYMQFLKKIIRKPEKPLPQIHRRLAEKMKPSVSKSTCLKKWPVLKSRDSTQLPEGCIESHRKLLFPNFELTTKRPNNCCILKDSSIIFIRYIGKKNNDTIVIAGRFLKKRPVRNLEYFSHFTDICEVDILTNLRVYSAKEIEKKACLFDHKNKLLVVPLIHH